MTTLKSKVQPSLWHKALALLLVLLSIGLGLMAWSSLYNLALALALNVALGSQGINAGQRTGIIRTTRALAMMCGGGLWLAVAIGSFGYHSEFLGTRRSWRVLKWTIGIEVLIIALDRLYALLF
jgi:hypothetical protein